LSGQTVICNHRTVDGHAITGPHNLMEVDFLNR